MNDKASFEGSVANLLRYALKQSSIRMIDLYLANSGNSLRAAIALEKCGLEFRKHILDLDGGDQKRPEFLRLNSFGMVPVMIDEDGANGSPITLSQSGLIMLYAAEKAERFLPQDKAERLIAIQWFMAAISDVAPANAIIKYFGQNAPDRSEGNQRYLEGRLLALLEAFEGQIGEEAFILKEISVADLALFPIIHLRRQLLATSAWFPVLLYDRMLRRDAIQRAIRPSR